MATTSYGVNNALAVKLWSRKLFHEALKQTSMARYMGNGSDSMIQIQTDTSKGPGDRITVGLRMQLSGAGIQGDGTLEGNEEALTTYSDNVFIDQLRHAVRSAGKMSEQRIPFSVREEARMGLQDWWSDRIDQSIINQLCGVTTQADTRYTGNQATIAASTGHVLLAGVATTEASLSTSASYFFSTAQVDRLVATAKTLTPIIRPIKVDGGDYYIMFIHPYQTYQLRTGGATAGSWADIQKARIQGGEKSGNPIFTNALGVWNNTILVENPRIPLITTSQGAATGARAVFCGAQAGLFAVGQDNQPEKMSWVEELFDYENQLGVSAGMIWGMKKTVFNSLDFGTITLSTYSPAP